MQHIKRIILSVLLIAAVLSGTAVSAAATDLPPGVLIGDQNGIKVSVDGSYFIDAEALQAGDVITKRLTIMNTESYSYDISMTAEPLTETGPLKLLDETHCTLKLNGAVIYDGRVRGDDGVNMIQNALKLGNYTSGQQRTLDITLTVDPQMKTYYWTPSEALFKWNFYAARKDNSPDPKTGEAIQYGLYAFVSAAVVASFVLLILIRRKKNQSAK